METLETKEIESAVEAILFASGEPVQTERVCIALGLERPAAEQILQKLMDYYAYERRGIRLLHMAAVLRPGSRGRRPPGL